MFSDTLIHVLCAGQDKPSCQSVGKTKVLTKSHLFLFFAQLTIEHCKATLQAGIQKVYSILKSGV